VRGTKSSSGGRVSRRVGELTSEGEGEEGGHGSEEDGLETEAKEKKDQLELDVNFLRTSETAKGREDSQRTTK